MRVSICKLKDVEEIYSISKDRIIDSTLSLDDLSYYCINRNFEVFKLLDDDDKTIAGYCILRNADREVEIDEIALKKDYEGKGCATYFLYILFLYFKDKNVRKVFLEVRSKNTRAIKLYSKFGFIPYRLRKHYYLDDDALCLVKELTND